MPVHPAASLVDSDVVTSTTSKKGTQRTLHSQIRFPTESYTREEFFDTTDNVRYIMKMNLLKSKQAIDVPIGIKDLIEFLGDVEKIIQQTDNMSVNYRSHNPWKGKLNITDTMLQEITSRRFEAEIEQLARDHGIALQKKTSLSGRGYSSPGMRVVTVNYSFGTYRENISESIQNPNTPLSRVEWVGGSLGTKNDLHECTLEVKSVREMGSTERTLRAAKDKIQTLLDYVTRSS